MSVKNSIDIISSKNILSVNRAEGGVYGSAWFYHICIDRSDWWSYRTVFLGTGSSSEVDG